MRVTNAGSWLTILCSWLAVLLGFSTVAMILAVTSGRVAMAFTFLTASATRVCGSASVAVGIRCPRAVVGLFESGGGRVRSPHVIDALRSELEEEERTARARREGAGPPGP